jgi:hypothetical protein
VCKLACLGANLAMSAPLALLVLACNGNSFEASGGGANSGGAAGDTAITNVGGNGGGVQGEVDGGPGVSTGGGSGVGGSGVGDDGGPGADASPPSNKCTLGQAKIGMCKL